MAEALRLANALERQYLHACGPAADELRRLYAENFALAAALASSCDEQRHQLWESGGVAGCERARVAERQRDALLEVVQKFVAWSEAERNHSGTTFWQRVEMCREVDALAHAAIRARTP